MPKIRTTSPYPQESLQRYRPPGYPGNEKRHNCTCRLHLQIRRVLKNGHNTNPTPTPQIRKRAGTRRRRQPKARPRRLGLTDSDKPRQPPSPNIPSAVTPTAFLIYHVPILLSAISAPTNIVLNDHTTHPNIHITPVPLAIQNQPM